MAQRIAVLLAVASILVLSCAADEKASAQKYDKNKHSYEKHDKDYYKPDYKKPSNYEKDYQPHPKSDYYKPAPAPYGGKPYDPSYPPYGGKPYPPYYPPAPYYGKPYDSAYSPPYGSYDNSPKFTKSVAEMSVSTCSYEQYDDYYSLMAHIDLTCSAESGPSTTPDGSCLIVYEFGLYDDDWYDNEGNSVTLTHVPERVGMWKADCTLSTTCLPNHGYGSPYQDNSHNDIDVQFEGVMLYVENVYSKSANCLGEGTEGSDDDDGLIRFCMDNASGESTRNTGDKSGRFERMQKRIEKEAAKWGRKINASKKPAKPGKSVDAKVAYVDPDAPPAEYYKLDFAYIMKGTITYYDDTGAVKWLGHVQIVEDLQFHYATPGDSTTAVKVTASELPVTATIVDCSEVEFKWLNAHNYY